MFLPPLVALVVGVFLIVQAASAVSDFGNLKLREEQLKEALPALANYQSLRTSIDSAESEVVVVNKHRPLSTPNFKPQLVKIKSSASLDNSRNLSLRKSAASALEKLAKDMKAQGAGKLFVNSAFRSFEYQAKLFKSKTKQYGLAAALLRSAKAGYSEHQTGLAADVSVPSQGCVILECFGSTKGGKWLAKNSWKYGFIIRYERDTTTITGYSYEPWHLRYVGIELASAYHDGGYRTLEEFWGLDPAPTYPDS